MDQPAFSTEGLGVEGVEGEWVDFDVHPGWRIALIAEGSREMVVYVHSRVDKHGKSSTAATSMFF